jgi:hypothetical protein
MLAQMTSQQSMPLHYQDGFMGENGSSSGLPPQHQQQHQPKGPNVAALVAEAVLQHDLQLRVGFSYKGNASAVISTTLILNVPTPAFLTLPVTLKVTGLSLEGASLFLLFARSGIDLFSPFLPFCPNRFFEPTRQSSLCILQSIHFVLLLRSREPRWSCVRWIKLCPFLENAN